MEIIKNQEYNGLELYFETKPNSQIIDLLKQLHFKWHTAKKCWYGKDTEENQQAITNIINNNIQDIHITNTPTITLKTLTKLTKEEAEQKARQIWQSDKKMVDYVLDKYDFYKTYDNWTIEIEKAQRISFSNKIYYDDETTAPTISLDNFISYNEHNCNIYDNYIEQKNKCKFYLWGNYTYSEKCRVAGIQYYSDYEMPQNNIIRELTSEELDDVLTLYKAQKEQYIQRLTKYFHRYNKHIYTVGYWANR